MVVSRWLVIPIAATWSERMPFGLKLQPVWSFVLRKFREGRVPPNLIQGRFE